MVPDWEEGEEKGKVEIGLVVWKDMFAFIRSSGQGQVRVPSDSQIDGVDMHA
mgnify:CR=1 FL=1